MLSAVCGVNWGDEGKGRMVDLLSSDYDVVCRYQGGNNAGHTVINERGKFILNLLPSGILREDKVNVMGAGMVIDLKHLSGEIERLTQKGVKISPENLKISDRAVICMPYHVEQDCLEEDRLAGSKFGSTRRGIGPVYGDKYLKKALRTGDLLYLGVAALKEKLSAIVEWKNLLFKSYGAAVDFDASWEWLQKYAAEFKSFICDTGEYLEGAASAGKNIMFEAQLGALRDVDYGIYPYTSSSNTIAAYAPIGSGLAGRKIDLSVGIMKAYSSCVGEGPFICELFDEIGDKIRTEGAEYGAATGRPRRVGGFDVPASKYGVLVQGTDQLALTKLDVLSCLSEIPVVTAYEINDKQINGFPYPALLKDCKPVTKWLKGWKCDITNARTFKDLPKAAQDYVTFIEKSVGAKMKYISVGAERNQYIEVK